MGSTSVLGDTASVLAAIGATEALVYQRVAGGRFTLVGHPPARVRSDLIVDDEPAVADALVHGLRRVACEELREICAGYAARAAAIVAVETDVVVVLGRRDGCLAGVSDDDLLGAARTVARNTTA